MLLPLSKDVHSTTAAALQHQRRLGDEPGGEGAGELIIAQAEDPGGGLPVRSAKSGSSIIINYLILLIGSVHERPLQVRSWSGAVSNHTQPRSSGVAHTFPVWALGPHMLVTLSVTASMCFGNVEQSRW